MQTSGAVIAKEWQGYFQADIQAEMSPFVSTVPVMPVAPGQKQCKVHAAFWMCCQRYMQL